MHRADSSYGLAPNGGIPGQARLTFFAAEFAQEPKAGRAPITDDGARGDIEGARGFFDGKTAEKAKLDDFGLDGVELGESVKGVVESNQFQGARRGMTEIFVNGDMDDAGAALGGVALAGVVDQDAADHLAADGEEMGAVLPLDFRVLDKAEEGFVDQGGTLERMIGWLPCHVSLGEPAEFSVDERSKGIESGRIAAAPAL